MNIVLHLPTALFLASRGLIVHSSRSWRSTRKIVGWTLSFEATVESAQPAWDQALCNEGLMDVEHGPLALEALSDHGPQMTAKSMKQFFKDLGISPLFARVQTPTDNAWIEAFFQIVKYDGLPFQEILSFHRQQASQPVSKAA